MTVLDWRGEWDITSVPVLDSILAGEYLNWHTWEMTRDARDTAQWLPAVRSHRWVVEDATCGYSDADWWRLCPGVLARRWALSHRCGPSEGFLPSTEVALRPRFGADHLHRTDFELIAELTGGIQ